MEMLIQLWRPEFELDGINSGSWYHCLPIRIIIDSEREIVYSCVRSSMLHGSETWPVRKENEVALQSAEMRMVRWMCDIKVREFQERLGLDDVISVLQQNRLRWYGHVL